MDDPIKVSAAAGVCPDQSSSRFPSPSSSQALPSTRFPQHSSQSPRRSPRRAGTNSPPTQSQTEPFMCPICCDDDSEQTLSLACGHVYCSNCWQTYLHTKIHDEGEVALRCMDESCKVQADDNFVRTAATKDDSVRYMELLVRDYVANKPQIKFCPHPGCQHALSCPAAATRGALNTIVPTVQCAERHEFCFGCAQEGGHRPVICSVSKMWLKKCADDSETANWIKSNTKECPKCQSTIEKNGGCK
jgi:ariadne-1